MCGFLAALGTSALTRRVELAAGEIAWRGTVHGYLTNEDIVVFASRLPRLGDRARPQPARSLDGDVLCLNGSIYNIAAVARKLGVIVPPYYSDTEALLLILVTTKLSVADVSKDMRGEYSLLFYRAAERTLVIARDTFGSKPLFYAVGSRGVVVSSSARAVAYALEPAPRLDQHRLTDYLLYGVSETGTAYESVASVAAASCVEFCFPWTAGRTNRLPHFDCAEPSIPEALATASRARCDPQTWLAYSGGIDSSAIVKACGVVPPPLFSVTDDSTSAGLPGSSAPSAYVDMRSEHLIRGLRRIGQVTGRPLTRLAGVAMLLLAELGVRNGLENQISGEGADELFGGYAATFDRSVPGHPILTDAKAASLPGLHALGIELSEDRGRLLPGLSNDADIASRRWFDRHVRLPEHLCQLHSDIPSLLAGAEARLPFIDLANFDTTVVDPDYQGKVELVRFIGIAASKRGLNVGGRRLGRASLRSLIHESEGVFADFGVSSTFERFEQAWDVTETLDESIKAYLQNSLSGAIIGFWSTAQLSRCEPALAVRYTPATFTVDLAA